MTVYEVRIEVLTPIAVSAVKPEHPIHLDALLLRLKAQRLGISDYTGDNPKIEIPLEETGRAKKFYRASAMFIDRTNAKMVRDAWVTSTSWLDCINGRFVKIEKKIYLGAGPYRQKAGYVRLICTPEVRFYFAGDPHEVADLLEDLKHTGLGIRTTVGYGQVGDIVISRAPADYTLIGPDGYPSRVIPAKEVEKPDPKWMKAVRAYRPPYWWGEEVLCYLPPRHQYLPVLSPAELIAKLNNA
ncbi:hypothetical protein [Fervidicola ferrireducens]|nr:hypothetical protein [Fervidicola ferrireducens]